MNTAGRAGSSWVIPAVLVAVVGLFTWFGFALWRAVPPPALEIGDTGTVLRAPLPVGEFSLMDHSGNRFDGSRLEDRWSFLFFGYTSCPSVCPMTLGNFSEVQKLVDEAPDAVEHGEVQFVFVSIDPERDTRERLESFVPYFHSEFVGVTGSPEELEPLTRVLGIYHARAEEEHQNERDYLVDHTTSVMLIGPEVQLRAIFPPPHDPGAVATAFEKIWRAGG